MKSLILLLTLLYSVVSLSLPLDKDFQDFIDQKQQLSSNSVAALKPYQFVFIAGFTNELGIGILSEWQKVLRRQGIKVTIIKPSSIRSVKENIPLLKDKFEELYNEDSKPLIVVGHSKGGLESVATLLENPELANKVVKHVIAVQSPLCGCHLGDFSSNYIPGFLQGWPLNGLMSLSSKEIQAVTLDKIHQLSPYLAKKLSRQISYVVSAKSMEEKPFYLKFTSNLIGSEIDNDGLVAKEDMAIPGFGRIIGEIDADHIELMMADKQKNSAFIQALQKTLAKNVKSKSNPNHYFCKITFRKFFATYSH